jgi:methionyl aminopeptidase
MPTFTDEEIENFLAAGKIISRVREATRSWIKPGMKLVDIAERIEEETRRAGGGIAFPANLSLNELAAHYTPTADDTTVVKDGDLLKVDVGCHVDGYVADTAYTLSFNTEMRDLVKASENALAAAIELATPGRLVSDLSAAIEEQIKALGFNPISNLSGHGLGQYIVHMEPSVPNINFTGSSRLEAGQAIAIEPFATPGKGRVVDTTQVLIFRVSNPKPVRNTDARKALAFAERFEGLPFAQRWLEKGLGFSKFKLHMAMKDLLDNEALHAYPALREITGSMVSQTEHSLIVADPPVVFTK